jgi:hypothetical protein
MMIRAEKNYLRRYSILDKLIIVTALLACFCKSFQNDNTNIEPKNGTNRNSDRKVLGLRQQRQEQFRQDERRLAKTSPSPSLSPSPMLYTMSPTQSNWPTFSPFPSKFSHLGVLVCLLYFFGALLTMDDIFDDIYILAPFWTFYPTITELPTGTVGPTVRCENVDEVAFFFFLSANG